MTKKRRTAAGAGIVAAAAIIGFLSFSLHSEKPKTEYVVTKIGKTDIEETVSSSGKLKAVGTVDVLTQLTGTVEKIHADFNDQVKKDMPLAELNTDMLKISLKDSEASLVKARAQYEHDRLVHENNAKLAERNLLSEFDLHAGKTAFEISRANLTQAELQYDKARLNIDRYAIILSPIDGMVLARNVEEGQTVVANSGSVTRLFTLAANLDTMEIEGEVDELDIGRIRQGQTVRFDVEAYPDKRFEGRVRQIRMVPTESDNVVNYTVIVTTENKEGFLLPGMTANMDFLVTEKKGALAAPNAAFRFSPPETAKSAATAGDSGGTGRQNALLGGMPRFPGAGGGNRQRGEASGALRAGTEVKKTLWLQNADGTLEPAVVDTGLSNGTVTEIVDSPGLEGRTVILRLK